MPKHIRPTISLEGSRNGTSLLPNPVRTLTPAQEADLAEVFSVLRRLAESPFRGSVTLHLNGEGRVAKGLDVYSKIVLDTNQRSL